MSGGSADPLPRSAESAHWRRNLMVAAAGSFTTVVGITLVLPILPLFVRDLGVADDAAVTTWSGIAYAGTFVTAALTAPLWGHLGDRFGRKSMLIRASLGMAIAMSLTGFAQNVWQLVGLRLLAGLLGGYSSGATILVAAQTPKQRSGWALGVLGSAIMAGNVAGPLIGGTIAEVFSVQAAFVAVGGVIFLAFLGTALLMREERVPKRPRSADRTSLWRTLRHRGTILALLGLSAVLMFATLSAEPIITVHVERLTGSSTGVALLSSVVFALTALGTVLAAPRLGRIADRVGHLRVLSWCLIAAAVLLALQAIAPEIISFAALRFATGIALGGITPTVVATIRRLVPDASVGLVLGWNVSAQYVGQVTGPIVAGAVAGLLGTAAVFLITAGVMLLALLLTLAIRRRRAAP